MNEEPMKEGAEAVKEDVIRIADNFAVDVDYLAGASLALLGKRAAGKTYTARVIAEELFAARVQEVIMDPMGVFWGLRSSADGNTEGLPIPVFGGTHGDAPLESSAGALMADLAVTEGLSMILDMSGFGSRTQERKFAGEFFDRLYRRNRDLIHVIVDEADLFAPQRPRGQDAPLLATMENIVRRGRNRGIGTTMASQRAAVLHKDVLTQVDALIAMRVTAPQDRDAIRDWVQGQGDSDTWADIAPSLPSLADGESWWWIPSHGVLERVQVRRTHTFDSSPTRRRGESSRVPKTHADVDLSAITDRIAASIERAKADDPRELRRRIRELEIQLDHSAQKSTPADTVDLELRRRIASAAAEVIELTERLAEIKARLTTLPALVAAEIQRALDPLIESTTDVEQAAVVLKNAVDDVGKGAAAMLPAAPTPAELPKPNGRAQGDEPMASAGPRAMSSATPATTTESVATIAPARQRILDALAELEEIGIAPADKAQVALWAGVSPKSSGYSNNLGALRTLGLLDYPGPARVQLTPAGLAAANRVDEAIASNAALHDRIRSLVPKARWRILEPLIAAHPDATTREDLAESAGVSATSSGYANNLGALRTLGLLDYPDRGYVRAADILFPYPVESRGGFR